MLYPDIPSQILLCLQMLQHLLDCVRVNAFNHVQWKHFQIKECAYFRYITASYIGDTTEEEIFFRLSFIMFW